MCYVQCLCTNVNQMLCSLFAPSCQPLAHEFQRVYLTNARRSIEKFFLEKFAPHLQVVYFSIFNSIWQICQCVHKLNVLFFRWCVRHWSYSYSCQLKANKSFQLTFNLKWVSSLASCRWNMLHFLEYFLFFFGCCKSEKRISLA